VVGAMAMYEKRVDEQEVDDKNSNGREIEPK
jgi:hypothetical protein